MSSRNRLDGMGHAETMRAWYAQRGITSELLTKLDAALPEGVVVESAGGKCPVQVDLHLPGGEFMYFRARDDITVEIWPAGWVCTNGGLPDGEPVYFAEDIDSDECPGYAGWIGDDEVVRIIVEQLGLYRAGRPS